jgi:heme A synthase
METFIAILAILFMLSPAFAIALAGDRTIRARVVWTLAAVLPLPLVLGGWVAAVSLLNPPGGIHSNYGGVAAVVAFFAPWVIYGLFKRTLPKNAN